ncbi:hypothetical protein A3Q56_06093, partial [Intoshia linei]
NPSGLTSSNEMKNKKDAKKQRKVCYDIAGNMKIHHLPDKCDHKLKKDGSSAKNCNCLCLCMLNPKKSKKIMVHEDCVDNVRKWLLECEDLRKRGYTISTKLIDNDPVYSFTKSIDAMYQKRKKNFLKQHNLKHTNEIFSKKFIFSYPMLSKTKDKNIFKLKNRLDEIYQDLF